MWALDVDWLEERLQKTLSEADWALYKTKKDGLSFKRLFLDRKPPLKFIGTATPRFLNQRLSVQQGVFLSPGDVTTSWMANLGALARSKPRIIQFEINRGSMKAAFEELGAINVTARSLFPGIDGYARSMSSRARQIWKTPILGE